MPLSARMSAAKRLQVGQRPSGLRGPEAKLGYDRPGAIVYSQKQHLRLHRHRKPPSQARWEAVCRARSLGGLRVPASEGDAQARVQGRHSRRVEADRQEGPRWLLFGGLASLSEEAGLKCGMPRGGRVLCWSRRDGPHSHARNAIPRRFCNETSRLPVRQWFGSGWSLRFSFGLDLSGRESPLRRYSTTPEAPAMSIPRYDVKTVN